MSAIVNVPAYVALAEAGIVGRDAELSLRKLGHMMTFPSQSQRAALASGVPEHLMTAFGLDVGRAAVVLHKAGLLE